MHDAREETTYSTNIGDPLQGRQMQTPGVGGFGRVGAILDLAATLVSTAAVCWPRVRA